VSLFREQEDRLVYTFDGETIIIEPWGKNSLRIRAVLMGDVLDTDYALLPQAPCKPTIKCSDTEASIKNGNITAIVKTQGWDKRGRISFYNQQGQCLIKEAGSQGCLKLNAREFKPIIGGDYQLTASFISDENEKLYGMGQYQQEILDIKNCAFELAHRNAQASIPFVLSGAGYGFLWHNPAIGSAFFGKNKTQWKANSTKQLDYWITAEDSPAEIIKNYAAATGKPPMMPEYGLGFWQCKLRYWNQEQVLEVAREYKRRDLPIDVLVIDFFHWPITGDFRFDEELFPSPDEMVKELDGLGIKLMVSVWPLVDARSENFKEMQSKNLFIKPDLGVKVAMTFLGNGLFYDATNPMAREYLWQKCKESYYDKGIETFWLDVAEPEYTEYDFENYRYHMGPNAQIGNMYPQLYAKTFYDGMKSEGHSEVINLLRCAWAGSQRYGALVWSGDIQSTYEDFRKQVCAGLNMGMSGIPWWTTDIGGFSGGNPDDEGFRKLLVRWFQYGTFCPVMRLHGFRKASDKDECINNSILKSTHPTGGDNEVWSYGPEAYNILVKYMHLREKLRPVVRGLMQEAHETGAPVMRAMFYEFPGDETCWGLKDQYMFGGDILVAPILWEDAYERKVYLPKGANWTAAYDKKEYTGGQYVNVDAPLDVIPVFLRDGRLAELFH